ncbi:MAB_1171c family putative transporter [Streptomyces cyaneofuscatus]|uniref:MAB_1171c family putative transporter n=1 Tax=Streptomyces cyaneofuscatus TaxID=66883 RepID=UPI0037887670
MSADIADFGRGLAYPSVACLWMAVLTRLPSAVRSPKQRGLWLAVATAAAAMTLNLPDLVALAVRGSGSGHFIALTRNLIGVVSAGAVLYFVGAPTSSRRLKIGSCITVGMTMAALVTLEILAPPHREHGVPAVGDATPSVAYWVTLISAHLLANTVCFLVCWHYSRRTESRSLAASLRLFGLGTALAGLFWLAYLLQVTVSSTWALPYLPLLMNLHGLLRAAAILVPTFFTLRRLVAEVAVAWHLWPLWRDLVRAVPHVALTKPRARLVELLWPPVPRGLLVYRKVIEIRDAILILNEYIEPEVPNLARSHVAAAGGPASGREAAVLACVIMEACRFKVAGRPQQQQQQSSYSTSVLESGDLEDEKRFLVALAHAYGSASTRTFKP